MEEDHSRCSWSKALQRTEPQGAKRGPSTENSGCLCLTPGVTKPVSRPLEIRGLACGAQNTFEEECWSRWRSHSRPSWFSVSWRPVLFERTRRAPMASLRLALSTSRTARSSAGTRRRSQKPAYLDARSSPSREDRLQPGWAGIFLQSRVLAVHRKQDIRFGRYRREGETWRCSRCPGASDSCAVAGHGFRRRSLTRVSERLPTR